MQGESRRKRKGKEEEKSRRGALDPDAGEDREGTDEHARSKCIISRDPFEQSVAVPSSPSEEPFSEGHSRMLLLRNAGPER